MPERTQSERFDVIPPEIIEAWAKGEYQVGDIPSLSYTQLGTALFLRSWYTYGNASTGGQPLAGVAKIDIKGPFLVMGGIRLQNDSSPCAVFWASEASHFIGAEILWFYTVFKDDSPGVRELTAKYGLDRPRSTSPEDTDRFGLKKDQWNDLLTHLRIDFDDEIEGLRHQLSGSVDRGMLAFNPKPDAENRFTCLYHQRYDDSTMKRTDLISGATWFKKALLAS